jgi:hypothetical protein
MTGGSDSGCRRSRRFEPAEAREGTTDLIGRLAGPYEIAVAADPAYLERYARMLGASSFSNVNLDPDLPSVARVALDLFRLQTGEQLDGMVLLDPFGLQQLLAATGDRLPVPARVDELLGTGPDIAVSDFARLVTVDVYATLGEDRGEDRREALRLLGDAAFAQVAAGRVGAAGHGTGDGRRLLRAAPAGLQRGRGGAGRVRPRWRSPARCRGARHGDLLAVTANNAVGGKQDVHLGHGVEAEVELDDVRRADDRCVHRGASEHRGGRGRQPAAERGDGPLHHRQLRGARGTQPVLRRSARVELDLVQRVATGAQRGRRRPTPMRRRRRSRRSGRW